MNRLPKWVGGVNKNLLMTKDSAVFKGLNRAVQYGDFVAKATLYDHLTAHGQPERDVIDRIMEESVQYNRNAGRGRDAVEELDLLWLYSYNLRIMKVATRMLRKRPYPHPPPTIAPTMRMTAIPTKTARKLQDRSVRRADERRCRAMILRVHGSTCPTSGVCATTDTAQGENRLINWPNQAILQSKGMPLGKCRIRRKKV